MATLSGEVTQPEIMKEVVQGLCRYQRHRHCTKWCFKAGQSTVLYNSNRGRSGAAVAQTMPLEAYEMI
jgi:hypothetical protein